MWRFSPQSEHKCGEADSPVCRDTLTAPRRCGNWGDLPAGSASALIHSDLEQVTLLRVWGTGKISELPRTGRFSYFIKR